MMNTLKWLLLLGICITISCGGEDQYTITPDNIGIITKTTTVAELETLFKNDSLVIAKNGGQYADDEGTISIYEKGGNRLLLITPKELNQRSSIIENIRVFDSRYQTDKGISLNSTFKDIQDVHGIKRIDNLLDSVVIFLEENDVYFTIDKKHLSGEFMFDTSRKIEVTNIPDDAPIKYMMIGW